MGQNEEMAWLEQLRYWEEKREILETEKEYWKLKLEMIKREDSGARNRLVDYMTHRTPCRWQFLERLYTIKRADANKTRNLISKYNIDVQEV